MNGSGCFSNTLLNTVDGVTNSSFDKAVLYACLICVKKKKKKQEWKFEKNKYFTLEGGVNMIE